MIGICGANGTGKTTLAKAFSDKSGLPLVMTGASEVFKSMGLDPKVDYPLAQRIEIQRRILDSFERQYRSVDGGVFVTDRTPIDMMAYTLADVRRENVTDELSDSINDYLIDCVDVSNTFFAILMAVQPGIEQVEREGKAPHIMAYVEHINALVMGIMVSEAIESAHYYIPRDTLDIDRRVECIDFAIKRTNERFTRHKEILMKMGEPMVFH